MNNPTRILLGLSLLLIATCCARKEEIVPDKETISLIVQSYQQSGDANGTPRYRLSGMLVAPLAIALQDHGFWIQTESEARFLSLGKAKKIGRIETDYTTPENILHVILYAVLPNGDTLYSRPIPQTPPVSDPLQFSIQNFSLVYTDGLNFVDYNFTYNELEYEVSDVQLLSRERNSGHDYAPNYLPFDPENPNTNYFYLEGGFHEGFEYEFYLEVTFFASGTEEPIIRQSSTVQYVYQGF